MEWWRVSITIVLLLFPHRVALNLLHHQCWVFSSANVKSPKRFEPWKQHLRGSNFLKDYFFAAFEWVACFRGFGGKKKLRISKKRSNIKISPKLNKLTRKSVQNKKNLVWLRPFDLVWLQKLPGCSSRLFQIAFLWPDGLLEAVCRYVVMLGRMGCFQMLVWLFAPERAALSSAWIMANTTMITLPRLDRCFVINFKACWGSIAQWLAELLSDQATLGSIPSIPIFFRADDGNQWQCILMEVDSGIKKLIKSI